MFVRIFNKIESKQRLGVFLRFTCFTLKILEFISFAICDLILQCIPYKAHTRTHTLSHFFSCLSLALKLINVL